MNNSPFSHHELKLQQLRKILPKIFGDMDDQVFNSLLPYFEWKELHGNRFLFRQGDVGNKLFILISGRLQVVAFVQERNGLRVFGAAREDLAR